VEMARPAHRPMQVAPTLVEVGAVVPTVRVAVTWRFGAAAIWTSLLERGFPLEEGMVEMAPTPQLRTSPAATVGVLEGVVAGSCSLPIAEHRLVWMLHIHRSPLVSAVSAVLAIQATVVQAVRDNLVKTVCGSS